MAKHTIDVDITTPSGVEDVSSDVEEMSFDRTVQLKACPFMIKIENSDGSWDDKFEKFDEVKIQVEKTAGGGSFKEMFGGRIVELETERRTAGTKKRSLVLRGFNYFHDLQGILHTGVFLNTAAGTIITNILQSEAPHINTTNIVNGPILDYYGCQDKPISQVIEDILDQPECVGYRFWLVGKHAYFKDLSSTFAALKLTQSKLKEYDVKRDVSEFANRAKVYGALKPLHPEDADQYTEEDAANWTTSNITLSDDAVDAKRGDFRLKAVRTAVADRFFRRAFTEALNLNNLEYLYFWFKHNSLQPVQIRLETDAGNYYHHNYNPAESNTWVFKEYEVGADALGWTAVGSPDWRNITAIRFFYPSTDGETSESYLDYLHFVGNPIIKVAEDWSSIQELGLVKEADPIVDASIHDPEFAESLAQARLAALGEERLEIKIPQRFRNVDLSKFNEGELVSVSLPDEDISDVFTLWETRYHFSRLGLEVEYHLGDKPSEFMTQLKFMMRQLERIRQAQINPTLNYDVWNRFYVPAPLALTTLLNDIGVDLFDLDALLGKPLLLFPFTFPGEFGGVWPDLTITES